MADLPVASHAPSATEEESDPPATAPDTSPNSIPEHTNKTPLEGASATSTIPPDVEPYDQDDNPEDVDAELEAMKKRLKQMEDEANAVKAAGAATTPGSTPHAANSNTTASSGAAAAAAAAGIDPASDPLGANGAMSSAEADARSIYVGNVDYGATPEELQAHFSDCGTINRVTILCNKVTGVPKGFAYIEFVDREAVQNAIILNESPFRGRPLKVTAKRTNVPGLAPRGGRGGRGTRPFYGYRGRGFGRGRPRGRWVPY